VLDAWLDRTGLAGRPDAVATSQAARAYKPHPRVFELAAEQLGVQPGRILHVGDSPGEDRAGALVAGFHETVLVDDRGLEAAVERAWAP